MKRYCFVNLLVKNEDMIFDHGYITYQFLLKCDDEFAILNENQNQEMVKKKKKRQKSD